MGHRVNEIHTVYFHSKENKNKSNQSLIWFWDGRRMGSKHFLKYENEQQRIERP